MAGWTLDTQQIVAKGTELANHFAGCQVRDPVARLLGGVVYMLARIYDGLAFGQQFYRVRAVTIGTSATRIIDKDTQGRVRKVDLWLDQQQGGPVANVRVSDSSSVTSSGSGARMVTGAQNVLGEVHPDAQLYAISSVAINGHVIERA